MTPCTVRDRPEGMTFEAFVACLRVLEAQGRIVVVKWPAHEEDPIEFVMTDATMFRVGAA